MGAKICLDFELAGAFVGKLDDLVVSSAADPNPAKVAVKRRKLQGTLRDILWRSGSFCSVLIELVF